MKVSAISFDVDMTLIDTDRVIMRSMESVRDELMTCVPGERSRSLTVEQMWSIRDQEEKGFTGNVRDFDEIRRRSFLRMLDHVGYKGPDLSTRLNEVYMKHRYNDIEPYEDVVTTLDALDPHYKLGLLSNGNNYPEYFGLAGRFDFAVFAQDIGIEKPDLRTFQIAAQRAGCDTEQLLHVGDSLEADVAGAQAVGICAVWLNRDGVSNDSGIKPDYEIRSLAEMPALLSSGLAEFKMYSREIKVKEYHSGKERHSDKEHHSDMPDHFAGHQIHLQTVRLGLRPFRVADFEIAAAYYQDPEFLHAMEGEPPDDPPTADSLKQVGRIMAEQGFLFAIVERASGRTIGEICLQWMNLDRAKIVGEKVMRMPIGIWDKSLWGRGYGREVVCRLMEYAFEVLEIDRLRPVDVSPDNARSVALWRTCGLRIAGESSDGKIDFEITRPEYVRKPPFHPAKSP